MTDKRAYVTETREVERLRRAAAAPGPGPGENAWLEELGRCCTHDQLRMWMRAYRAHVLGDWSPPPRAGEPPAGAGALPDEELGSIIRGFIDVPSCEPTKFNEFFHALKRHIERRSAHGEPEQTRVRLSDVLKIIEMNGCKPGDIVETEGKMQTFMAGMNKSMQMIYKAVAALAAPVPVDTPQGGGNDGDRIKEAGCGFDSDQLARSIQSHLSLSKSDTALVQGYLHRAFVSGTEVQRLALFNAIQNVCEWERDYRTRNNLGRNPPACFATLAIFAATLTNERAVGHRSQHEAVGVDRATGERSTAGAGVPNEAGIAEGMRMCAEFLEREADANFMPNEPTKLLIRGLATAIRVNMKAFAIGESAATPDDIRAAFVKRAAPAIEAQPPVKPRVKIHD